MGSYDNNALMLFIPVYNQMLGRNTNWVWGGGEALNVHFWSPFSNNLVILSQKLFFKLLTRGWGVCPRKTGRAPWMRIPCRRSSPRGEGAGPRSQGSRTKMDQNRYFFLCAFPTNRSVEDLVSRKDVEILLKQNVYPEVLKITSHTT